MAGLVLIFLLGRLIEETEGSGTAIVKDPLSPTYGALDLGGASTQISFYQPDEDIMSNLFKLQIGQGKHWNVYTHSFLYYGVNEAWNRVGARIVVGATDVNVESSIQISQYTHHPCLPEGSSLPFYSGIHFDKAGTEKWIIDTDSGNPTESSYYASILFNNATTENFDECYDVAKNLINKVQGSSWCRFAHKGDCSFAQVYQPPIPKTEFGGFLAFSEFYYTLDFLGLEGKTSVESIGSKAKYICSMNLDEIMKHSAGNNQRLNQDETIVMCFRAVYVYSLLRDGYGFHPNESITAANVIDGQRVGWALGSMLYEINSLPWKYIPSGRNHGPSSDYTNEFRIFIEMMMVGIIFGLGLILGRRYLRLKRRGYSPLF